MFKTSRLAKQISMILVLMIFLSSQSASAISGLTSYFNYPKGSPSQRAAIRSEIRKNIRNSRKGDYIRLVSFAFHDNATRNLLVNAHKRGVYVQLVIGVTSRYGIDPQVIAMQKKFGSDSSKLKHSWVVICDNTCRGGANSHEVHSKIYLFSRNKVAFLGSANLTYVAVKKQWNEIIKIRNEGVYNELVEVFNEMKEDSRASARPIFYSGPYQIVTYPRNITKANDHLLNDLEKVRCSGATGKAGVDGKTVVYISQYAWTGDRGVYLANRVAEMHNNGCKVFIVLGGGAGDRVLEELKNVPKIDYNTAGKGPYNHEKWMAVSGRYGDDTEKFMLWTGSLNWTDRGEYNDEVSVRVDGDKAMFDKYAARIKRFKASYDARTSSGARTITLQEDD